MSHPTTAAKAVRRYQTGDVITVFVTARPEFEGHTPGPWIIQAHGEFTPARVIAPHGMGNGCPCEVVSGCDPADAALLAAAPTLLAERDALRAQVAELRAVAEWFLLPVSLAAPIDDMVDRARAALARVRP